VSTMEEEWEELEQWEGASANQAWIMPRWEVPWEAISGPIVILTSEQAHLNLTVKMCQAMQDRKWELLLPLIYMISWKAKLSKVGIVWHKLLPLLVLIGMITRCKWWRVSPNITQLSSLLAKKNQKRSSSQSLNK
jgi:hypothetical protein